MHNNVSKFKVLTLTDTKLAMRFIKALMILTVVSFLTTSCFEDNDDNEVTASQINDFVWRGMNIFYLYKDDVPDLANDRFSSNNEYASYLNSFSAPEELFESLIYERQTVDRFSWIVDDYIALEQSFNGISLSNGMEFRLFRQPNSNTKLIGIVRLVLNNSDAEAKGVERGDIFYAIDDTELTIDNYLSLLSTNTYTIHLANYNTNGTGDTTDDTIEPTNETIALNKVEYSENPVYKTEIISTTAGNVGYLMYNRFTSVYDSELNAAFGAFKANNVQHLVLDLRYNPGGFVSSAVLLSSMITGQFNGDIFSTEQWNSEFQAAFEENDPESLNLRFTNNIDGNPINSLNLQKVYILALESSASASELVINSLDPYIEVIHIGENTAGKYQASITLYDSEDFGRQSANPTHAYAMQPLVYKSANKVGNTDYFNGLTPDIALSESDLNLGVIGDKNEKLLAAALADIEGISAKAISSKPKTQLNSFKDSNSFELFPNTMYSDKKIPKHLLNTYLFEEK